MIKQKTSLNYIILCLKIFAAVLKMNDQQKAKDKMIPKFQKFEYFFETRESKVFENLFKRCVFFDNS